MITTTVGPALAARAVPGGLPALRRRTLDDIEIYRCGLDPHATPGDPGLFGPDSPTWQVMANVARPIAGSRSAILQAMLAPIPAATDSTGGFARDFLGRVNRTASFVQQMNLGSIDEVYKGLRRVRAVHRQVTGTSPDGVEFDATDVDVQAWVSMTFTESLLVANQRFGARALSGPEADRFVREQSTHGALLDERVDLDAVFDDPRRVAALRAGDEPLPSLADGRLPVTVDELRAKLTAFTPQLTTTPLVQGIVAGTREETARLPRWQQTMIRGLVAVSLSTLPDEWYEIAAPGRHRPDDRLVAAIALCALTPLQAVFGQGAPVDVARARTQAGSSEPVPADV